METHEFYMQRCIQLAKNGFGNTYPNPMVGAVIVYEHKIIGEGWHKKAGEPHAEVNAINSVKDKNLLKKATIYVTLEPCSHFGKTPPCCDLILANEIPNIVIGTTDPFEKVAGTGIQKLKEAGKNVIVGILEQECNELNKRFFTFHTKKRPYIILKFAQTADGFIAPMEKNLQEPFWISNPISRQKVHQWRAEEQAIFVGTRTVLNDNPKLNIRDWTGTPPIRIVLDRTGKISDAFAVKNNLQKTIILTENSQLQSSENTVYEPIKFDKNLVFEVCNILYRYEIQSVIIEGGAQTLQTFITENLWDEARIFSSKTFLKEGIKAPKINGKTIHTEQILNDTLEILIPNTL